MLLYTRLVDTGAVPPACTLTLTHQERARSRLALMGEDGTAIGISLPRGTVLRDGDWLATEDGQTARVAAAPEPLLRVSAASPLALLRVVYHLANRHVPAQIGEDAVLIEPDPVLEHLLVHLGARVEAVNAAFAPEPGAYEGSGASAHGHHHHHGSGHHHHGDDFDEVSAKVGEALSIAAHARRLGAAG